MAKIINSYECMFVVSVADETATKATVQKFVDLIKANAEIVKVNEWGNKRLAYPIQDMNNGYYTVVTFKTEGAFPAELQRLMNIDETVIRSMTIKLDYDPATVEEKVAEEVVEETVAETKEETAEPASEN